MEDEVPDHRVWLASPWKHITTSRIRLFFRLTFRKRKHVRFQHNRPKRLQLCVRHQFRIRRQQSSTRHKPKGWKFRTLGASREETKPHPRPRPTVLASLLNVQPDGPLWAPSTKSPPPGYRPTRLPFSRSPIRFPPITGSASAKLRPTPAPGTTA